MAGASLQGPVDLRGGRRSHRQETSERGRTPRSCGTGEGGNVISTGVRSNGLLLLLLLLMVLMVVLMVVVWWWWWCGIQRWG
ncbi:hypothetical protein EYF80_053173 [Liparis tanakae]|uniref:Uncharacterized protein n=1 Tax=Liparis tanakae TaxID=230148 RepID=A0A4Z2F5Y0_9TELE|nr:hypothetical protein EYF80_053173 [Liparis tanakae]